MKYLFLLQINGWFGIELNFLNIPKIDSNSDFFLTHFTKFGGGESALMYTKTM